MFGAKAIRKMAISAISANQSAFEVLRVARSTGRECGCIHVRKPHLQDVGRQSERRNAMGWSGSNQRAALQALEPASGGIADSGMARSVNIEIESGGFRVCLWPQACLLQQHNPRINRGQLAALPEMIRKRIHSTVAEGIDAASGWTTSVDLVDASHGGFSHAQRPAVYTPVINATCKGFEGQLAGQRESAQNGPPATRRQV